MEDFEYALANEIERNGEPTVARLARGLADALATPFRFTPRHSP